MLSPEYWNIIQRRIRGAAGHTLGLAALDSDVQRDLRGAALLHFTPLPTPGSKEVDVFNQDLRNFDGTQVNAYVFLRLRWFLRYCVFSRRMGALATVVVPGLCHPSTWWPLLQVMSSEMIMLSSRGPGEVLLCPTKHGFLPCVITFVLSACRLRPTL